MSFLFNSVLFQIFLFISIAISAVLGTTWLITTVSFYRKLSSSRSQTGEATEPATIPYAIPWLGSAMGFLNEQGKFYDSIRSKVGNKVSICKVQLGPEKSYIPLSAATTEAVFQSSRYLSTDKFVRMIEHHGFDMPIDDVNQLNRRMTKDSSSEQEGGKFKLMYSQAPSFQKYLIDQSAVNELTTKFIEVFRESLNADSSSHVKDQWITVDLYSWLKERMLVASVTAMMGSYVLEVYPEIANDFWAFEGGFLQIVYGTPKFMAPKVYAALKRCVTGADRWLNEAWTKHNGDVEPSMNEEWEPYFGARLVRARQQLFHTAGISMKGRASLEIGLLFGLASNAIPSTGWMLFHILSSPQDILPRVLAELSTAQNSDGTLDIPKLISLPLYTSIYTEILRMYVAGNITREIHADFVIDGYLLKKGATIMAPTWLGHRDPDVWNNLHPEHPPVDQFYAERFLRQEGEKIVCSTAGLTGKYFPYGGGAHICPGRFFAKQEILAAVAIVLLGYDFEFVKWVNPLSEEKEERFPKTKKGYVGNGVMAADRDMRVRMRRND